LPVLGTHLLKDTPDASQIASVTAIEWHVPSDLRDEIMEWYESCVVTKMTSSPDVLRHRLFELDNATVLESAAHSTKAKESLHTYFSFVEFDTEDWPWDVILELAETEKWREWFEGQKVVVSCAFTLFWEVLTLIDLATRPLFGEETLHRERQGR
jgi:hypothetical protein